MVAVIGMGILIVAGVTVIVVTMVQRMSSLSGPNASVQALVLDEPAGSRIASASMGAADRLTIQLGGGGPDRVLIVDLKSGRVIGRVALAR